VKIPVTIRVALTQLNTDSDGQTERQTDTLSTCDLQLRLGNGYAYQLIIPGLLSVCQGKLKKLKS